MIRVVEKKCAPTCVRAMALLAGVLLVTGSALADPNKGTTSRAARTEARKAVPIQQLDARYQKTVGEVLARPSIYRRLPVQSVTSDADMFDYLTSNPDVIINIWRLMGVTNMKIHRVNDRTFIADDGVGTKTQLVYVLKSRGMQVIYADGAYDGSLTRKPIQARCVLVLRSNCGVTSDGKSQVTTVMDTFIKVDHFGAAAVAKTLQPLIGRTTDFNFRETVNFIGKLSRTAEVNPDGVGRLAGRLKHLRPEVRDQFAQVAQSVGRRGEAASLNSTRSTTSQTTSARIPQARLPRRSSQD
ncbi:MAG: hypothetical protein MI757_12465 [Pirellulales bacterium]|nr:hypothetical protein [Pirellulales bacterium]